MLAPKGTGFLYIKSNRLEDIKQQREARIAEWNEENPWPFSQK